MIEVVCNTTQDHAEATTPRGALVAARTLIRDAVEAHPVQCYRPTCTFYVAGEPVPGLVNVSRQAVWFALGGGRMT